MATQMELSWVVSVAGTSLTPAEAANRLAAVVLYQSETSDPVLGQFFGLTVAEDDTEVAGSTAVRTLVLNMDPTEEPAAPPCFPCHPQNPVNPALPYKLLRAETLEGQFRVNNGSTVVATTQQQMSTLNVGDSIRFVSQQGVAYVVASKSSVNIGLSGAYTGTTANTTAFREVKAPVTIAAIYSSSELDTAGVATVPAIAPGNGARTVALEYKDSTGAGPFTATVQLTGKRPAAVSLEDGGENIAEIVGLTIAGTGDFDNSVGQLTLVELSADLAELPPGLPLGTGIGPAQDPQHKVGAPIPRTFKTMTDEAQELVQLHLAYLPSSFYALAQPQAGQGAGAPPTEPQLAVLLGQFVQAVLAAPPPGPPFLPATIPTPDFLSGMFTKTLQLALAGVPVIPQEIVFA